MPLTIPTTIPMPTPGTADDRPALRRFVGQAKATPCRHCRLLSPLGMVETPRLEGKGRSTPGLNPFRL
jgi:hypothetical protein